MHNPLYEQFFRQAFGYYFLIAVNVKLEIPPYWALLPSYG